MRWPPFRHVFFDCDSTLTAVEGIDALAEAAGAGADVEALTRAAMDGEIGLEEVYGRRLQAVRPTRAQVRAIRHVYKRHAVADAAAVIAALQALDHEIYIISGGLAEPVEEFGVALGVPRTQIRAVAVDFDALGADWWRQAGARLEEPYMAYEAGALTMSDGKAQIVRELRGERRGRALLVGDGMSDLHAAAAVDLFVGFGGVVLRTAVRTAAPVYVDSPSLAPVLALAAGPASLRALAATAHAPVAQAARDYLEQGAISFNDERLAEKFNAAYQAVYPGPDGGSAGDS